MEPLVALGPADTSRLIRHQGCRKQRSGMTGDGKGCCIALPTAPRDNAGMARLRRRWRVLKWAGVAVLILLTAVYGASFKRIWYYTQDWGRQYVFEIQAESGQLSISFGAGQLDDGTRGGSVVLYDRGGIPSPRYTPPPGTRRIWGSGKHWLDTPQTVRFSPGPYSAIHVPLWIPFLLVAVPTALIFWRDRRIPPHFCQSCGYDLTGNVSGVCSECGRKA